ncbi:hypothetical protein [Paenibacillus oceani]|uniref:Uncharacterized protein n=1 Tax=Paenibacillus oceani TaxID=2772510 RepID=A0A927H045_9BACL|nr:hypothetical protein [Paenibacillus oceani]MBD2862923.1 hypothetical protein [Paenibacillus oceani]
MASFRRTLANMLRAGFPLIHVRTWEEDRTLETINQIASNDALIKTSRHVYTWNLLEADDGNEKTDETKPKSLLEFLGRIELITWPAIIVVYDIHSFFTGNSTDFKMVRMLKIIHQKLKSSKEPINILFLSATVEFPKELEKDIVTIEFPLPGVQEIEQLLDTMIGENEQRDKIRIDLDPSDKERLVQAALGLTLREAENAYSLAMVQDSRLCKDDVDVVLEEKRQIIKRSGLLEYIGGGIKWTKWAAWIY